MSFYMLLTYPKGWVGADNAGREADGSYRPFLGAAPLPPGINKEVTLTKYLHDVSVALILL